MFKINKITIEDVISDNWLSAVEKIDWEAVEQERKAAQRDVVMRATVLAICLPLLFVVSVLLLVLGPKIALKVAALGFISKYTSWFATALMRVAPLLKGKFAMKALLSGVLASIVGFVMVKSRAYRNNFTRHLALPLLYAIEGVSRLDTKSVRATTNGGLSWLVDITGIQLDGENAQFSEKEGLTIREPDYVAHLIPVKFDEYSFLNKRRITTFSGQLLLLQVSERIFSDERQALLDRLSGRSCWGQMKIGWDNKDDAKRAWHASTPHCFVLLCKEHAFAKIRLRRATDYPARTVLGQIQSDLKQTILFCRTASETLPGKIRPQEALQET